VAHKASNADGVSGHDMVFDQQLILSDLKAITVSAASSNVIDDEIADDAAPVSQSAVCGRGQDRARSVLLCNT
jgi:hypothetical protein